MATSVRELIDETAEAARRADLSTVAQLYHPNAALHVLGAGLMVGRESIAEHFSRFLGEQPADLVHEVTEEHLHEVTPDLAIVDTIGTSRWGDHESGVEGFTMIAVRDDSGEWLWAGVRGALVPGEARF
jgi:uncharacterized protein (TIGR02246 family)